MTDDKDFEGHTPGPWLTRPAQTKDGGATVIESAPNTANIGFVWGIEDDEPKANARLIAAAPDLLAERNELRAENERLTRELAEAEAACRHALQACYGCPRFECHDDEYEDDEVTNG